MNHGRLILVFFLCFMLLAFLTSSEAKTKDNIFDIEINLYTAQEMKEFFPNIELTEGSLKTNSLTHTSLGVSYNYLFGWVRLKEGAQERFTRETIVPNCRIKAWSKFFSYTFTLIGLTEQKSYFLIPLGNIYIPDRNFDYLIQ